MGLFTRDCYDEDRDNRISKIGLEAYNKEVEEYIKSIPPTKWSTSDPKVTTGDIIGNSGFVSIAESVQMYINSIDDNGEIWGRTVCSTKSHDKYNGKLWKWTGDYKVVNAIKNS